MISSGKLEQIISGGYCIGCGACKIVDPSIEIELDESGKFQATTVSRSNEKTSDILAVCPFSDEGPNEDVLGKKLFGDMGVFDSSIGYYRELFIGHVIEGSFRADGASGGMISWLLTELLRNGNIDSVIHVKKVEGPTDGVLFRYGISRTDTEIREGAKSRYYPVEMTEVLKLIREQPGRYAVVGLPCFIKAVRRLSERDSLIKNRVVFCIGLVCGHLKSKAFADYFGWQKGIPPGQLDEIDFRVKLKDRPAGNYGVYLRGAEKEIVTPARELLGSNWGYNFFRYSACDCCDDVFAETADIAIGDAWLPEYDSDFMGNSIIVIRNMVLAKLFEGAGDDGRLHITSTPLNRIVESQAGGLRDRREGLAYRLYLKNKKHIWHPQKRVDPQRKGISYWRRRIYATRSLIGETSHAVWRESVIKNDIELINSTMDIMIKSLERIYARAALLRRIIFMPKRICTRVIRLFYGK